MKHAIIASAFLLAGCAQQGRENYNAQRNVAAATPNEYAQQIHDYMQGALIGFEHGKTCTVALSYGGTGLLESVKARGGDSAFCAHIMHYVTDPLYPVPNAPLEMRSAPIVLDFKS